MRNVNNIKIGFVLDLHGKVNNPISRLDNYVESILDKVEQVLKENDVIVFCGDIFNTYLTGINFINKLLTLLVKYESLGKSIKMIAGNHDIIGRVYSSWVDTSLGTLALGRNWMLDSVFSNRYFRLVPMTFEENGTPIIPKIPNDQCTNILVGHAYFNHPEYNDKWNVSSEVTKGFDFCVLGHDHQEYPITELDTGCFLLRSGSISRMTIDDKDRDLKYPQIIIEHSSLHWEGHDCEYIPLKYKPAEEVFKGIDTSKEIIQYKKNVQKMIELLQVEKSTVKEYSLDEALVELKCPTKYKNIISEVLNG